MHNQPIETSHRFSSLSTFPRGLTCLSAGLFFVLLLCGMGSPDSPAHPHGPLGAKAKRGEAVFQQHCISCHNKKLGDTMPFGPPNLNSIFRGPSPLTTKQAKDIVVHGKGTMPAWGAVLTLNDVDDVVAYLKTW
jgi:mono/diheme cytochrome c family protein